MCVREKRTWAGRDAGKDAGALGELGVDRLPSKRLSIHPKAVASRQRVLLFTIRQSYGCTWAGGDAGKDAGALGELRVNLLPPAQLVRQQFLP